MRLARGRRRHLIAGAVLTFLLFPAAAGALPDNRDWEMVSPVDKNGGRIAAPGELLEGGVLQASPSGESVAYGSAASFGADAKGAPPASQYVSTRGSSGWGTENVSLPLDSGSYPATDEGVPYRLFSTDLARAIHHNGRRCDAGDPCLRDYYLRESLDGSLIASPPEPDLLFVGGSPDLRHVVLSTCAALVPGAAEVPLGDGCDPAKPNLYLWEQGSLELVNATPGAALAAQGSAVSGDGSRIYWRDLTTGGLFLREGSSTKQLDDALGGGGAFQTATADGSVAFFAKAGHLYRYLAATDASTDLTPFGGMLGMLGASPDGTYAYYQDSSALRLWHSGVTTTVAPGAAAASPGNYPPSSGTSRVAGDGTLLFLSKAQLTPYNNNDQKTGQPDTEALLYEAATEDLRCVSCRPNGTRPIADSTIPGSVPNGTASGSTASYKPRALSADGNRVIFDTADILLASDTNKDRDVYQWEAKGTGSCTKAAGCIDLISSGRAEGGAVFVDASADGSSAFFITDGSLVDVDPGAFDLYVARVGGGFPDPVVPISCSGDSCQSLPPEPADPPLSTLFAGPGNPAVRYVKTKRSKQRCKGRQRGGCRKAKARHAVRGGRR